MVPPDSAAPTRDEAPAAAPAMLVDGRTVRGAGTHDVVDPGTGRVFTAAPRGRDAVFAQVKDVGYACSPAHMGAEDDPGAVVGRGAGSVASTTFASSTRRSCLRSSAPTSIPP